MPSCSSYDVSFQLRLLPRGTNYGDYQVVFEQFYRDRSENDLYVLFVWGFNEDAIRSCYMHTSDCVDEIFDDDYNLESAESQLAMLVRSGHIILITAWD